MKYFTICVLIIFFFSYSIQGQDLIPKPKYRVGLSYDQTNSQFSTSFQAIKNRSIQIKYELGVKIFNLRDKNITHRKIENTYIFQKTYNVVYDDCSLCGLLGYTYERGPDKILLGDTVKTYGGFYPYFAIPLSQTFFIKVGGSNRFNLLLGAKWFASYVEGLKIIARTETLKVLDNTQRAEIIKAKQMVITRKQAKLLFGGSIDAGLECRVLSDYYIGINAITGFNFTPNESSVSYAAFADLFYQLKLSVSKDF